MTAPHTFSEGDHVALATNTRVTGRIVTVSARRGITVLWDDGEVTTTPPRQLVHREVTTA